MEEKVKIACGDEAMKERLNYGKYLHVLVQQNKATLLSH